MRRGVVLLLPLLIPGFATRSQQRVATPNRVVVITQGVRVTASLPLRTYPRNALVSVGIGLRNISRHVVYIPGACAGPTNPNVSVRTNGGHLAYPPLVPAVEPRGPLVMACMAPLPRPLKPGRAMNWRDDAVLRGTRIDTGVGLGGPADYIVGRDWIHARLQVWLTTSDAPRVTVATSPAVRVQVRAAPGAGPLIVSDWWFCPGDIRANGARDRIFQAVTGTRLALPCTQPTEWHGVVGRMGHSVARFDYVAPPWSGAVLRMQRKTAG